MSKAFFSNNFICPLCRTRLVLDDDKTDIHCENGHRHSLNHGVIDLYVANTDSESQRDGRSERDTAILMAVGSALGLAVEELEAIKLLHPITSSGNAFFDAEEELFIERFGFVNVQPSLEIESIYSTGLLPAGRSSIAVRIKNISPFVMSSSGSKPVYMSYHIKDKSGRTINFEGLRSALPIDLKSGQAVTTHVEIDLPPDPVEQIVEVIPVHETVSWLDENAKQLHVNLILPGPVERRLDEGRPFSEDLDNDLALSFLTKHLGGRSNEIYGVEIGGGLVATLSRWMRETGRSGNIVNNDISIRLLKLAAAISAKSKDEISIHARFDANRMPIEDESLDTVLFSRSLHHFERPSEVLTECRRVLKPDGLIFLVCEPVGQAYDDFIRNLMRQGVNEQVFPLDAYINICSNAGLECVDRQIDWGFSLKAAFKKTSRV